jgi:vitamin B12 transport system substrate-binding protein
LVERIEQQIQKLQQSYDGQSKRVFYYLNDTPLMALGNDKWLNDALSLCNLDNVFKDSIAPYPQVSMAQVLRLQPEALIAGNSKTKQALNNFWAGHSQLLNAPLIQGNPDKLHRFTPRAIDEITRICQKIYS